MKWEFYVGEGRIKFETRKINCTTVSNFYYSNFICSDFCKDVLGAIFNFKHVSIMDHRTAFTSNCVEKACGISQNRKARMGLSNRIRVLFSASFSVMVYLFEIYDRCQFNDYFSAPAHRIFSWRIFSV